MAIYEARQKPWKRNISQWCHNSLSDKHVQSEMYQQQFGRPLNWEHPTTFNEKLQWMSLNYRRPIQTQLADKYAVREFVKERGSESSLNDLYGVWDNPADINFDVLPNSFILKVTHGSGQNMICKDKADFKIVSARRQLAQWMTRGEYWVCREWAYKNITPRIICERLLSDEQGKVPTDYKFFCFSGEPRFIQVDTDRFEGHRRDMFDLEWALLPFNITYASSGRAIPRPDALDAMIAAARTLSHGFPFVRVDFYSMGSQVIFGEMTWYPEGGLGKFIPDEYDTHSGEMIVLPR
jgi:hypothetical protein